MTTNPQASLPLQRVSDTPLGVVPAFTQHNEPVVLKLQEKRLSMADAFQINDAETNRPVLECDPKMFSAHHQKAFNDASGKTLFLLKKQVVSLHTTYDAVDAQNASNVLFTIKKNFSVGKAKLNVIFNNAADGQKMTLALRGDFFDRNAAITLGTEEGPVVGQVAREFLTKKEFFLDKQTYYLMAAPGVDYALLAAICVCLDETEND